MIKKILVPLDGSQFAECALSYAAEMAAGLGAKEVVLLSVTERIKGYRVIDDLSQKSEERLVPEGAGKKTGQASRYLAGIAKGLEKKGIHTAIEVAFGKPAEEIIVFARTNGIDLIVMSSHGRSGPSRWAFGSVADKVFRCVEIPVLMVKAPGCAAEVKIWALANAG